MRLICPNCGAQYEVPEDVIPTAGRDVQCSNCGNTWFQPHPSQDAALAEELEQPLAEDGWDDAAEPEPEPEPEPDPESEPEVSYQDPQPDSLSTGPEYDDYDDDYEAWDDPAPVAAPPVRKALDPELADLLREEAELEARQRAAEHRQTLESQPDLGLDVGSEDEAERRNREAQERMAMLRGENPVPDTDPAMANAAMAAAGSRRALLPDIDEINSTLRSTNDRRPATADDHDQPSVSVEERRTRPARKRSGFRRGFMLMLLLAVIALCLYIFAPQLGEAVPALKPALQSYVDLINGWRIWLDDQLKALLTWLDSLSSAAEAPEAPAESAASSPDS